MWTRRSIKGIEKKIIDEEEFQKALAGQK